MTSEVVVLLISILCLVKCTWCGNYGFAMGQIHSNHQILLEELLTNENDSNETIIEYVYTAEKPVTYMQLRTDTNIYTEVTLINSNKIYIKLSNFENIGFNATLTVFGFPWHPDGPEPDDGAPFLLEPNVEKEIYLNESSVEESDIIATNGAYTSREINSTEENSSVTNEYYDYDIADKFEPESESESIFNVIHPTFVVTSRSATVKLNFLIHIYVSFVFVLFVL